MDQGYRDYLGMDAKAPKEWRWRWLVPGLMQIPVCFVLMAMGFKFGDLKSLVMFLYAFPYIMSGFEAFFHKDFDDIAKDCYWPIAIFDAVIQLGLQTLGFCYVVVFVSKQYAIYNNKSSDSFDEETPTFISCFVILLIELVLVATIFRKIYKLQRCARISKYWSEKILQVLHSDKMKSTNLKKDVDERNEDENPLLDPDSEMEL